MPITTSDILVKLSTKTGSAGNSQAQADPDDIEFAIDSDTQE